MLFGKAFGRLPAWGRSAVGFGGAFLFCALLLGLLLGFYPPVLQLAEEPSAEGKNGYAALQARPIDLRYRLVLDAGHGGMDPGAVAGNVAEADVNQEMVDRLMALLAAHEGELDVVQAHTPGEYAPAMARANTAAAWGADLLVSLHLNAHEDASYRGFSCYPLPPGRRHHEESLRFARLLVEEVGQTGLPVLGSEGIAYTYFYRTDGGYYQLMYDSAEVDEENPPMQESFGVVEYAGCPAVLVEQWFLSNPQDMALCYTSDGMDQMARCLYQAICRYFGLQEVAAEEAG